MLSEAEVNVFDCRLSRYGTLRAAENSNHDTDILLWISWVILVAYLTLSRRCSKTTVSIVHQTYQISYLLKFLLWEHSNNTVNLRHRPDNPSDMGIGQLNVWAITHWKYHFAGSNCHRPANAHQLCQLFKYLKYSTMRIKTSFFMPIIAKMCNVRALRTCTAPCQLPVSKYPLKWL